MHAVLICIFPKHLQFTKFRRIFLASSMLCVVWVAFLINCTKKDAIQNCKESLPSPLHLKGTWCCQVARHCSELCKKCTTDSTGSLLSSCHSRLANWWRNKLCYRKQRTDSRHRDLKSKSESFKNKDPLHVSRKKELNNDDVTCFKTRRKRLERNELRKLLFFYFSPVAALILMGLQWWLAITDCFERRLLFRYSQVHKTYPHSFFSWYFILLVLIMLHNKINGCT